MYLIKLKNVDPAFARSLAKEFKTITGRARKKTILKIKDDNVFLSLIIYLNKIKIDFYIQCVSE